MTTAILSNGTIPSEVSASGGAIIPTSIYRIDRGFLARVENIKIVPSDTIIPYTIKIYKFVSQTATPELLYSLDLSAGDWVDDDTIYSLNASDAFFAYCSVENLCTFVINGTLTTNNNGG